MPTCECEITGDERLVDDYGDCAYCGRQAHEVACPMCDSPVAVVLGGARLAHRTHYRCRACGITYSIKGEEVIG